MRISVAALDYLYSPGKIRYIPQEILDALRAYPDNHSSARDRASRLWTRKAKQAMSSIVDAA